MELKKTNYACDENFSFNFKNGLSKNLKLSKLIQMVIINETNVSINTTCQI